MVYARYNKSKKHKKLKSVDPSAKSHGQSKFDPRKAKKHLLKEKQRIQKLSEQHIPKTISRLFNQLDRKPMRKKRDRSPSMKVVTNMDDGDAAGATKPLKSIPKILKQGRYESETSFLKRLDKLCMKVHTETKIEEKYHLGEESMKDGSVVSSRILRRRERDKKRKSKKKKNNSQDYDFFPSETNIFLPA